MKVILEQFRQEVTLLSPPQRNQRLRSIYEMLPPIPTFDDGVLKEGSRPDSSWTREAFESAEVVIDNRGKSPVHKMVAAKHAVMVRISDLLPPGKLYVLKDFRRQSTYGIEREDVPSIGVTSDLEYYARLFGWKNEEYGGIYDPNQVQQVEKELYRQAANTELRGRSIQEIAIGELAGWAELTDQIKASRLLRQVLTGDELARREQQEKKENERALQMIGDEQQAQRNVRRWRELYIARYNDEP